MLTFVPQVAFGCPAPLILKPDSRPRKGNNKGASDTKRTGIFHLRGKRQTQAGFSLVELVVAVALLAVISGIGFSILSNYRKSIADIKLENDVTVLNNAVTAYLANGGSLYSVTEIDAVLAKLKTRAESTQAKQIAGMKGSFVDPRITAVMQDESELSSSAPRATWDVSKQRFRVVTSGVGAKEFALSGESKASVSEERNVRLKLASEDPWIWDYQDARSAPRATFTDVPIQDQTPTSPEGRSGRNPRELRPPEFSVAGGTYPLAGYSLSLSLIDANPPGRAKFAFTKDGKNWIVADGSGSITVEPGETVTAYAFSIDPDLWTDSPSVIESYLATPVELELALSVPKLHVNYAEVGGTMMSGSGSVINALPPGFVTLENSGKLPSKYQNDGVFNVHWTLDGSEPSTSGTKQTAAAFSAGFPGQFVDYSLGWWGSATVLPIQAMAQSANREIAIDSKVVTQVLEVNPIALRAPEIRFSGSDVILSLVTNYGDMPEGARIFYTVDGSEPGDLNGAPTSGTLYKGPIPISSLGGAPIRARVYAPETYEHWFTTSTISEQTPIIITFTMGVTSSSSR